MDGDGLPNYLEPDDDGDGIYTYIEGKNTDGGGVQTSWIWIPTTTASLARDEGRAGSVQSGGQQPQRRLGFCGDAKAVLANCDPRVKDAATVPVAG